MQMSVDKGGDGRGFARRRQIQMRDGHIKNNEVVAWRHKEKTDVKPADQQSKILHPGNHETNKILEKVSLETRDI